MFGSTIVHMSGYIICICRKRYIVRHWIFREKSIVQPCLLAMFLGSGRLVLCICPLFCVLLRFCASGHVFILLLYLIFIRAILRLRLSRDPLIGPTTEVDAAVTGVE